jgi:glycosyltransferase involved in cell wall biosynthesis
LIFIITEYFYPFSDAGGPIRSIEQILGVLGQKSSIKLITSANNHQGNKLPLNTKVNQFINESITDTSIYYSSNSIIGVFKVIQLYLKNRHHTFYINGMFIPRLSLLPALICKNVIISPRGMLIYDTFGSNSTFKTIYLFIYKLVVSKNAIWHATDAAEVLDIKRFFGERANVKLITNIPVKPFDINLTRQKKVESLKLVYFGLIVQKKGLLSLIQTLKSLSSPISLDIYGSIKDRSYWEACLQEINFNNSQATFNYLSHANPSESQSILAQYDVFVLLTKGENFGHSIYESLSVGTPVIITDKTPWKFNESANPPAWIINNDNQGIDTDSLKLILTNLYHMDYDAYSLSSKAAHKYAVDFYNSHDFKKEYTDLFNSFYN